jgi:adenosylmethionine-8-amino-7-oxononanoate aminotransferase
MGAGAQPPRLPNSAPAWQRDGHDHVWHPYAVDPQAPPPLPVKRTDGVRLYLEDGRELVDGIASWWTACHGYNHPHIAKAMQQQAEEMPHVMFGGLAHESAYELATRLAGLTPGDLDHVFFADGGSVAVEIALKMALQYFTNQGISGRTKLGSFTGAYHGDTFAAMAVGDPDDVMHQGFEGLGPESIPLPLPTDKDSTRLFRDLMEEHGASLAAVVVEPLIQGAGGMLVHEASVLQEIRQACDRTGVLLIADEIFTGFGRTGRLFACEEADIVPDIICLGKAMTGGVVSLSAAIARTHIRDAFADGDPDHALMHGPTFMANPLACAAANASLDLFESEPRLAQVAGIEAQLKVELLPCRDIPGVADVRIKGAMGAVELEGEVDGEWLKQAFLEEGVFLRPLGNIVYLTPPYIIEPDDLRMLTRAIRDVLERRADPKNK